MANEFFRETVSAQQNNHSQQL